MASSLKIVRIATKRPSASCWNSSELARLRPKDLHVRSQSTSTKLSEESDRETVRKPQPASFVMGMFSGQTVLRQVLPFPDVLDDDQLETINMMRDSNLKFFTEVNDSLENDEKGEVKAESYRMLAEMGSFGAIVPVQYEGAGMNATQSLCLSEIAGQYDLGLSVTLGVHGIGYRAIIMCGTEEQKQKYLPDLATGKKFAAFALTEPGSGSDAGSIKTRAELSPDGKHYILNGSKIWISNGGLAEVFTIFAKTSVKMPNGEVKDKITAFIVERDFGGITNSPPMNKMGLKCSNTVALYLDNVKVPVENVLGEIGGGFKVAMNVLNGGRYGMAGLLSGTMRTLIEKASQFANDRIQFGSKISSFENVQEKLARMAMLHYTTESIGFMVAGNIDSGSKECHLEAAIGKIYSSEAAWNVCDETMQIMGGMGYMRESGVEKIMRDLRIFRVFEGANDILRLFIALTGLQNAGSNLKELQKAFKNPVANLELIFGESTRRAFRAVGLGSGPSISEHVTPELRESATLVTKSIENFGATVEHLLIKYNRNIISEQFLLTRLADSAIDIYLMIVTISRASRSAEKNYPSVEHEIKMVKVICSEAFERSQRNLHSIRANENLKNFSLMKDIAKNITSKNGVYHTHPIRLS